MKRYIIATQIFLALMMMSCTDYFESDSSSVIKADKYVYASELEARAGLIGLLQGMQQTAEDYCLMGELRGDLMTTTVNSSQELHDIAEFNATADNSLLNLRTRYALINDCNYYISHIDTTLTQQQDNQAVKYMVPYMVQAKAIRAWTYLNLCLDYGKVSYTTQPILDVANADQSQTMMLDELLGVLVNDMRDAIALLPAPQSLGDVWVAGFDDPGFTSSVAYDGFRAKQLLLPLKFILGELYMWQGDFGSAVQTYYELILHNRLLMCDWYNSYSDDGSAVTVQFWPRLFESMSYQDVLTSVVFSNDHKENEAHLHKMATSDYTIAPSSALVNYFNEQFYFTNKPISGDLRGLYGTYSLVESAVGDNDVFDAKIDKYGWMRNSAHYYLPLCRSALIYLRYAEALNRLGNPKLAFNGFLKYGLCAQNFKDYQNTEFKGCDNGEPYIDFGQKDLEGDLAEIFRQNNKGFHARGCGKVEMNPDYKLEEQPTLQDSIMFVEDAIMTETVLEMALEGNRFHDLMRISRYRNDPSYLANKVAAKFPASEREPIRAKLMVASNWYLPTE